MSWLFSQALVAVCSQDTCSDGAQSAPSSGNPTQLAYLPPDRMTAFSRLSRFGMTFKPLTADRGEALLMSYLEAFRAKTSPQQEKEQASTESEAECGEKWHGWLAKFDPDTSSLRTAQCSLLEEEPELLQTLPRSGMTRSGMLWERQTLVHRINATESGLWRSPDTGAGGTSGLLKNGQTHRSNGQPIQIRLVDQVANSRLWPTPTVCGNYNRKGLSKTSGDGLATAVSKWPTPTVRIWKGGGRKMIRDDGKSREDMLDWLVEQNGGRLNPTWVEWLMGWPLGWTDLKPLEMDKFQQWRQQHSIY
jgi:hypothetical protein